MKATIRTESGELVTGELVSTCLAPAVSLNAAACQPWNMGPVWIGDLPVMQIRATPLPAACAAPPAWFGPHS